MAKRLEKQRHVLHALLSERGFINSSQGTDLSQNHSKNEEPIDVKIRVQLHDRTRSNCA